MANFLKNKRGQTSLEYLLLLSATFISAYFIITGPLAGFTQSILADIRGGIQNTVKNGEWKKGNIAVPGDREHPSDSSRTQALHL